MSNFWSNATAGFTKGINTGMTLGLSRIKQEKDAQEKLDEEKKKLAVKNQQTREYAKLIGAEVEFDMYGQGKIKTPEGWKYVSPSAGQIAETLPLIGNEYQQAFTQLEKEKAPDYAGTPQYIYNEEAGNYEIKQLNKKSGQLETIGTASTDQFKRVKFDQTIRGEVEIDGQKFGKKGRDTRIKVYEHKDKDGNPYVEQLDLGITKKSSDGKKELYNLDDVDWLNKISDINERLDNIKIKQNNYLYGKFPPPDEAGYDPRELVRQGINSDLNEIATQYMKMGSPVAKNLMLELYKEGADLTKSNNAKYGAGSMPLTRTQFYQMKRDEITADWIAGEYSDRDAEVILAFLDAKFNQWIPSQDSKRNDDELDLDTILNELDENK